MKRTGITLMVVGIVVGVTIGWLGRDDLTNPEGWRLWVFVGALALFSLGFTLLVF